MSTRKIPQYGDPELLPKGVVRAPSNERMPFTSGGVLKSGGPGPAADDFLSAPDIEGLPWRRDKSDSWTNAALRQVAFNWLIEFFRSRPWARQWRVHEVATADRSMARLKEVYLLITITASDGRELETSVSVDESRVTEVILRAALDLAATTLDVVHAQVVG